MKREGPYREKWTPTDEPATPQAWTPAMIAQAARELTAFAVLGVVMGTFFLLAVDLRAAEPDPKTLSARATPADLWPPPSVVASDGTWVPPTDRATAMDAAAAIEATECFCE